MVLAVGPSLGKDTAHTRIGQALEAAELVFQAQPAQSPSSAPPFQQRLVADSLDVWEQIAERRYARRYPTSCSTYCYCCN